MHRNDANGVVLVSLYFEDILYLVFLLLNLNM